MCWFKRGPVEFYLTKTANWVRAPYRHGAPWFPCMRSGFYTALRS